MSKLQLGDKAPDFELPNQDGKLVRLYERLKERPQMLVFYPGDFTPVCTKQLCSYQDSYERFFRFGIGILGISKDPVEKHKEFHKFSFDLLSDPEKKVIDAYGAGRFLIGGRANFIVGKDATVLYEHVELVSITHRKTVELLQVLEQLKREGKI